MAGHQARIILRTLNTRLAGGLSAKLLTLWPETPVRNHASVGPLSYDLYVEAFGSIKEARLEDLFEALAEAATDAEVTVDTGFLQGEWQLLVNAWAVPRRDACRDLPRLSQRTRMAASRRVDQWDVFAGARDLLTGQGKHTRARMLNTHCHGGGQRISPMP